jgi:hypothetical protein
MSNLTNNFDPARPLPVSLSQTDTTPTLHLAVRSKQANPVQQSVSPFLDRDGIQQPLPVSAPQSFLSIALSRYAMMYNSPLTDEDAFGAALALAHLDELGMKWD